MVAHFDDPDGDFFRDSHKKCIPLGTAETVILATFGFPAKKSVDRASNSLIEKMFWLDFHTHERFQ